MTSFNLRGFPCGSDGKASACNAGDPRSIPGSGRSPGTGNGNPLQYSCLKIPWTEEPGGLQSIGSQRVGLNWATSLHFTSLHFTSSVAPFLNTVSVSEASIYEFWEDTVQFIKHIIQKTNIFFLFFFSPERRYIPHTQLIYVCRKLSPTDLANHDFNSCILLVY